MKALNSSDKKDPVSEKQEEFGRKEFLKRELISITESSDDRFEEPGNQKDVDVLNRASVWNTLSLPLPSRKLLAVDEDSF